MDDGNFTPKSTIGECPDAAMDLDFIDELLFNGCWLETSDTLDFLMPGSSSSGPVDDSAQHLPWSDGNTGHLNMNINPRQQVYQEETEMKLTENQSLIYRNFEELKETVTQNRQGFEPTTSSGQSGSFLDQDNELGKRWWFSPRPNRGHSLSVKDRLMQAICYLKEYIKDGNTLVQIWVPINRGGKHVLTTDDQPYSLDPNCKSLESYRNVSTTYHFAADGDSKEFFGLPGRVFLGKSPEWTPDVHFFRSEEYPRVSYAQQYGIHGSLALPVFEQGSGNCLGVVEIVTTSVKINYRPELENVCKALEAVDLRSTENFINSFVKAPHELHHAAMPEIAEVLRSVCKTHKLPLALTWAPCLQERIGECQKSDENFFRCLLTVDSACVVADENLSDFVVACSEHRLLQGQGIVGKAFTLSKQCFTSDITAFSKSKYPLSHLARMFGLRAALAIPFRSINTGAVEFVIEFFLPKECHTEEQKWIVNSLPVVIQKLCHGLQLAMEKELEEVILPIREEGIASDNSSPSEGTSPELPSWNSHMIEAQQKGKGVSVSWEHQKEEPKEEFKVTTHRDDAQAESSYHKQDFPRFGQFQQNSGAKTSVEVGGCHSVGSRKAGEKRRTNTEKTISLQVLRQYFAGSLKDAAKSMGVCPTTLKRICRRHGITRWPSRKIKKVGHSLKKLQLVIDSVEGAKGAIQIESFYTSFPELGSPKFSGNVPFSSMKSSNHPETSNLQTDNDLFSIGAPVSKSPSSSCSQSSGSSTCCVTREKLNTTNINAMSSGDAQMVENTHGILKRVCSDAELLALNQDEPKVLARSQSHKILGEHATLQPLLANRRNHSLRDGGTFKVKATFGEEIVRFSLQPNWGFNDLQKEIARRFNVEDFDNIILKYLDDDHEWVLLTCDADLEECIDIFKSSQGHTIKISLHRASNLKQGKLIHNDCPS